jgi:hypothetical protein
LEERHNGIVEVVGSIPIGSTSPAGLQGLARGREPPENFNTSQDFSNRPASCITGEKPIQLHEFYKNSVDSFLSIWVGSGIVPACDYGNEI